MNSYIKGTKIYDLFEQIKNLDGYNLNSFNHLHLHNCVLRTKKYPIFNKYIDEYLSLRQNMVDVVNSTGKTALILASGHLWRYSTVETLQILLKHGANPNIRSYKFESALMNIVKYKNITRIEEIKLLLKYGAEINIQDDFGENALGYVLRINNPNEEEIVTFLVNNGSNINIKNKTMINVVLRLISRCDKNMLKIVLPTRKQYIINIPLNEHLIIGDELNWTGMSFDYWKIENIDYKLIPSKIKKFLHIIDRF